MGLRWLGAAVLSLIIRNWLRRSVQISRIPSLVSWTIYDRQQNEPWSGPHVPKLLKKQLKNPKWSHKRKEAQKDY